MLMRRSVARMTYADQSIRMLRFRRWLLIGALVSLVIAMTIGGLVVFGRSTGYLVTHFRVTYPFWIWSGALIGAPLFAVGALNLVVWRSALSGIAAVDRRSLRYALIAAIGVPLALGSPIVVFMLTWLGLSVGYSVALAQ